MCNLCKKSIPVDGDPGYFLYQTQDGFHFKSIDSLIEEGSTRLRTDINYKDTVGKTTFGKIDFDTDPKVKNLIKAGAPTDVIDKARKNAIKEYKEKYKI